MDKEEFVRLCVLCGYCTSSQARQYINDHYKLHYSDSDFEAVFRINNNRYNVDYERYAYIDRNCKFTSYGYSEREWN